ncbi:hypothetical protein [Bacillus sp. 2205SS5-2]
MYYSCPGYYPYPPNVGYYGGGYYLALAVVLLILLIVFGGWCLYRSY